MPKKTVELIVAKGNHYLIPVKGNQPSLYRQVQLNTHNTLPVLCWTDVEKTRNRLTQRQVSIFDQLTGISTDWLGLKSLIKVERTGTRGGRPYYQLNYYISSHPPQFWTNGDPVRQHWHIENRWHWVRDVVLGEDACSIHSGHGASNWAVVRSIVLNLLRGHGYDSITQAQRLIAHDLDSLLHLLE